MFRADWKGWDKLTASGKPNAISQMMCLPLESSRQPRPAQAEPPKLNPSSASSRLIPESLPLHSPLDLDSDGFTATSPFRLCDELESSVIPPMAESEEVAVQHGESEYSQSQVPTFRHSTFHTSCHIPSLCGHRHNHRPDRLLVHASGGASKGGQLHSRPVNEGGELLNMIKHAQNSMAVALQCVGAAAVAINAPAPDTWPQLQPHRNITGICCNDSLRHTLHGNLESIYTKDSDCFSMSL